MFGLYNIRGPQFQGPLEKLYQVHPVIRSQAAKFALHPEVPPDQQRQKENRPKQAAAAYARALNLDHEREPLYHVEQIMHRQPHVIAADRLVGEGWMELQKLRIKQLPVVDEQGTVVGLLTESGLLRRIIVTGDGDLLQVPQAPVSEVMASPVITADPMTDIRRIAKVMADYGFPALPIVDEEKGLVGIVTRGDILRKFANTPPLQLWS